MSVENGGQKPAHGLFCYCEESHASHFFIPRIGFPVFVSARAAVIAALSQEEKIAMRKHRVPVIMLAAFVFVVCMGAQAGEEKKPYRIVIADKITIIEGNYDLAVRRAETSDEVMDAGIRQYLELEKLGAEVLAFKLEQYAGNPEIVAALQKCYDGTQAMRVFLREKVKEDLNFGSKNIRDARSLEIDSQLSIMNIRQMLEVY